MRQLNNTESGEITSLASEGQGIMRKDGMVIFIPFTAPGDLVAYEITKQKKNFAEASLLKILQPAPERVTPRCKYFGTCGGCQLQHIKYSAQLDYKRKWIEDALKKIGKLDVNVPPVIPSSLQWEYRRRISLALRKQQNTYEAGYIATDHTSLLQIDSCPIFTEEKDPIMIAVHKIVNQLNCSDPSEGKATILKSEQGYILHFHFRTLPDNAQDVLSKALENCPFISGILASSPRKSLELGTIQGTFEIDGLSLTYNPKTFIQNHPEQSVNIYNFLVKFAKSINPKHILDLYCGIGISSLLLGKLGFKVKGIELNRESIALAKSNAKTNGLNSTEFIAADVENVLGEILEKEEPDFVIVNPPREGLSPKIIKNLQHRCVKSIAYISCMPATLARDLKALAEGGYSVSAVQGFDMFPQTAHVETVVLLQKTCP